METILAIFFLSLLLSILMVGFLFLSKRALKSDKTLFVLRDYVLQAVVLTCIFGISYSIMFLSHAKYEVKFTGNLNIYINLLLISIFCLIPIKFINSLSDSMFKIESFKFENFEIVVVLSIILKILLITIGVSLSILVSNNLIHHIVELEANYLR